jgi:hypothetical protein
VDDAEWEQVGRLSSFARYHKDRFKALKRRIGNARQDEMALEMNDAFSQMMRGAIAEDQKRQQLERQLIGR